MQSTVTLGVVLPLKNFLILDFLGLNNPFFIQKSEIFFLYKMIVFFKFIFMNYYSLYQMSKNLKS